MFKDLNVTPFNDNGKYKVELNWTWNVTEECANPECSILIFKIPERVLFEGRLFDIDEIHAWVKESLIDLTVPESCGNDFESFEAKYKDTYHPVLRTRRYRSGSNVNSGNFSMPLSEDDVCSVLYICVFGGKRIEKRIVPLLADAEIGFEAIKEKPLQKLFNAVLRKEEKDVQHYVLENVIDKKMRVLITMGANNNEMFSVLPNTRDIYISTDYENDSMRIKYLSSLIGYKRSNSIYS